MDWQNFWLSFAAVIVAALGLPYLALLMWAFIWPQGKVSRRLHPSPPQDPVFAAIAADVSKIEREVTLQSNLLRRIAGSQQPATDSLNNLELVTTIRRRQHVA